MSTYLDRPRRSLAAVLRERIDVLEARRARETHPQRVVELQNEIGQLRADLRDGEHETARAA
jgi:hypothetical protein